MPRSKKPRKKKHVPISPARQGEVFLGYSKETIEHIKTTYRAVEMIVYDRLTEGKATDDDMMCIKRLINHVQVSVVSRGDVDMSCREDVVKCLNDAAGSIVELFNRFPTTQSYVCKGDELRNIVDAVAMAGPYIDESIKSCPRQFVREFEAATRLEKTVPGDAWLDAFSPTYIKNFVARMS